MRLVAKQSGALQLENLKFKVLLSAADENLEKLSSNSSGKSRRGMRCGKVKGKPVHLNKHFDRKCIQFFLNIFRRLLLLNTGPEQNTRYILAASESASAAKDTLNQLGSIPWKINSEVMALFIRAASPCWTFPALLVANRRNRSAQ